MPFRRTPLLLHLAVSHILHEWLPPSSNIVATRAYKEFPVFLAKCGITRIGFLRHGKTSPTPSGGVDFDRQLAELGKEQAKQAGETFGRTLTPFYPRLLVSPAPRTIDSAQLFIAGSAVKDNFQFLSPSILYDGTMQPEGSVLFRKIGYAPLRDYLNAPDDYDRNVARTCLGAYAHNVVGCMLNLLQEDSRQHHQNSLSSSPNGSTLWMVGHAIYLPAAALGVSTLVDCAEGQDLILSTNTVEAEGYLIDATNKRISYLSRTTAK